MPHVQDSIAQLFQARIFADGGLRAIAPEMPQFFQYHHMILTDGHWYSQYPPGHPFFLMLGVLVGGPWLIDPLMGGLFVTAVVLLGPELFGAERGPLVGRLAGLLALVSPFFLLMSAEFMSHPTALAASTWGLYGYARLVRTGSVGSGVVAGAGFGIALLVRPFSAFGIGLPVALHALWMLRRSRPTALLAMAGVVLLSGLLLLLYNQATNGSPLLFGYEVLYGPGHGIGFGKGSWGTTHTLGRGLAQLWGQVDALNGRLFEWPVTSLWPLVLGLAPGPFLARRVGLLLLPVSLLCVHVFYWYSDLCFGPRYVYEALGPLLLLSAWGLVQVGIWIVTFAGRRKRRSSAPSRRARASSRRSPATSPSSRASSRASLAPSRRSIAAIVTLLLVVPVAIGLAARWPSLFEPPEPLRGAPAGSPIRAASYFQYFGPSFWGVGPNLHRVATEEVESPALVFVRFAEPTIDHPTARYIQYGCAFAFQEPDLAGADIVFARDLGAENEGLISVFPDRTVYLYDGNVESGTLRRVR